MGFTVDGVVDTRDVLNLNSIVAGRRLPLPQDVYENTQCDISGLNLPDAPATPASAAAVLGTLGSPSQWQRMSEVQRLAALAGQYIVTGQLSPGGPVCCHSPS